MSIFSKIFDRIRNHGQASGPQQTGTATSTAQAGQNAGQAPQAQANQSAPSQAGPAAGPSAGGAQQGAAPAQPVDVEAVLTSMAGKNPQKLNWRTSIVDLMKLVGMDSTLAERKELADELGYTGDKNDTAAMNIWLHKQVMAKMAANGGKVPASMLD